MRTGPRYPHLATAAFVVLGTTTLSATAVQAEPAPTGCPSSYTLLEVAPLTAQGYQVPAKVDDPNSGITSFGNPGNGDGWVCAKAIGGSRTTPWGGQIYQFWDNSQHS